MGIKAYMFVGFKLRTLFEDMVELLGCVEDIVEGNIEFLGKTKLFLEGTDIKCLLYSDQIKIIKYSCNNCSS